jgi:molybdopterin synthase catalytic subunit
MSIVARLETGAFSPEHELAVLLERAKGDGAIVSFTGIARDMSRSGKAAHGLVLEHHPALSQRSLEEVALDAADRFRISHVHIIHRWGNIAPGEAIVFAGAASLHRRAAFEAADYMMDRLKTEAVFWKRELGEAGAEWIEPTDADYSDRERWD